MEIPILNNFDFVRPNTAALYIFDGDGADSSENNNDLSYGGPTYSSSRFGLSCAYFSGSTYLRSTYPSYTSLQFNNFSAHFWMKSISGAYQTIFSFEDYDSILYGYQFGIWEYKIFLSEANGGPIGDPNHRGNSTNAVDGNWHWIVITRGSTYVRFYIDGLLDYQAARGGLGYNGYELACAGAWWYNNGGVAYDFLTGSLDQLHLQNIELSYATIRRMYAFQMGWI